MAVVRWFVGLAAAVLVAAGLDLAQIAVARHYLVLNLAAYFGGTGVGDWKFQLTLITWFAVAAALVGSLAGRLVAGPPPRWYAHLPFAVFAGIATGCGAPLTEPAAAHAIGVGQPVAGVRGAILAGVVVGALASAAALAADLPALWRGLSGWVGWVWLAGALSAWWQFGDAYYGTDIYPLGSLRYPLNAFGLYSNRNDWHLEIDAAAVTVLCGLLAWWAARRGERWPVLGAVSGPLLVIAVYLVGHPTEDEEYQAVGHVARWVLLALLG